ncbi:MAG: hypothetical protein HYY59_08435 [Candidatus Omnitrophica bacterium]|nr:hypothetical protein [Candidatus Omnitrophota bacterium]MBI2494988.1 hypothetical protein [Candidatus Omnitrophota bacterium]MBI3022009.1 hypothetical protein [Candidatus Omnitrophota bacterium]
MRDVQFLVTEECARLARWLRLMGYDTALAAAHPLPALYQRVYQESRVVVTRNHRVKAGRLIRVVYLESEMLAEQLRQLRRDLQLTVEDGQAFSRCDRCNVVVEPADKASMKDQVPPYVFQTQQAFHACPSCHRIYWAATHCDRIRTRLETLT